MIKIHYDKISGEILGRYPNEIKYNEIPEPFIEVSDCKFDNSQIVNTLSLTLEDKLEQPTENVEG